MNKSRIKQQIYQMKKIITLGAIAAMLCATSCSTDETVGNEKSNEGKEKIQFAAGDDYVLTSRAGFTSQTRIVARIMSESRDGGNAKCVRTVLTAKSGGSGVNDYSQVVYMDGKTRYWDDAHGRKSRLSVFAVAVPNKEDNTAESNMKEAILNGSDSWAEEATPNNTLTWTVSATQTETLLAEEDLTYSNNIQETGDKGVYTFNYSTKTYPSIPSQAARHTYTEDADEKYDGRLYFTQEGKSIKDAVEGEAGHFDKGQMDFKHSLSRVQVNLIKGDGYSDAFDVTNMQILNQKLSGTFNIQNASWSNLGVNTNINMAKWSTAAPRTDGQTNAATYESQMLPGYTFANNADKILQLTVESNTYNITNKMLYEALGSIETTTAMGKRYIFNIKIAKNKIQNITATVVDWDNINATEFPVNNAHIAFTFKNSTGSDFNGLNLYKHTQDLGGIVVTDSYTANSWSGEYTGPAKLTENDGKYTSNWFYDDNRTAYHLRMINDNANAKFSTADGVSSFSMSSGTVAGHDYQWGAPLKYDSSPAYSTSNGYADYLHKGIIANNSEDIHFTGFHMMSELQVILTTPSTGGVNLEGATVTLTYFYPDGTVDMGTGKVTVKTNALQDGMSLTKTSATDKFEYVMAVVPQSLVRSDGEHRYIGITIHTADNNEYYVIQKLSEINVTGTTNPITEWISGKRYIYTFNIKKTQIENITATIADWINITAEGKDITLED